MWLEVLLLLGLLWFLYHHWTQPYNYWKKKGFPYVKGTFPFGSRSSNILLTDYVGYAGQKLYNELYPHPIGGYYFGRSCELIVRDPELIKKILIKDFSHFTDRNNFPGSGLDGKNLFSVKGNLWRALRTKMTPTFTSGKLKIMFDNFVQCSLKLDEYFEQMANSEEEIDFKDIMARFTTDIISSCAFGLDVNSIEHPNNPLRKLGQQIFLPKVKLIILLKRWILGTVPYIRKITTFELFPKHLQKYLIDLIDETINYREKNNVTRNDFLDLLIDMKNKDNILVESSNRKATGTSEDSSDLKMDLHLITAQCFVFFAAGFETASSVKTYCLYELAMNPDIQCNVTEEIDTVLKRYEGQITYQALQEMTYMEQVIFETMRKYPTLPALTRICTKQYPIPETNLVIDEGTKLTIPVYALHHDPKYFPEPDKFLPERFSTENKSKIIPYTYLPFGEGPRICIGMRFGLLQVKTGIVTTLAKYRLIKTINTPEKLTFLPTGLVTTVKDNVKIKIVRRDK